MIKDRFFKREKVSFFLVRYVLTLLAITSLSLIGCGEKKEGTPVAIVGDSVLTLEELNERIPAELAGRITAEQKRDMVERWVEEELLYQESLRRGIDREAQVRALIERSRRNILVAELLEREIGSDFDVTEEEIWSYYEKHKEGFVRDELEIRARHILVETSSEAKRIRRRVVRGENFEDIAREESLDPSALDGGDLGYFSEEIAEPNLWRACLALKIGAISQPVRTDFGYHIIQVLDKKDVGTVRELDQVGQEIISKIATEKQREKLDELLKRLREKIKYRIQADLLIEAKPDSS